MIPYNTGKVKIGWAYQPKLKGQSRDADYWQTVLLYPCRQRASWLHSLLRWFC